VTFLRTEYPRPQFERKDWMNLNGEWEFEFDNSRAGSKEMWQKGSTPLSKRIQVPFAFQSAPRKHRLRKSGKLLREREVRAAF
jgi:hypothetical protein